MHPAFAEYFAHGEVVVHVFFLNSRLAVQVFIHHVMVGKFGGEVFGFDGKRRQKIGERAVTRSRLSRRSQIFGRVRA